MLKVRYNKTTGKVTGWWADRFGNHEVKLKNHPDEAMAEVDIPVPSEPLAAFLFDDVAQSLVTNPAYVKISTPDYRAMLKKPGITNDEKIAILMKATGLD